ncbi:MAG: acyl-CoA dehydrogenase family protein [Sphingorhabdus sp.]
MELAKIGVSEEQVDILDIATNFCRERSPGEKVRSLMESSDGYDAELWTEMAGLGWMGIAIPEAHGGIGLSLAEVVPIVEQMGRNLLASPFIAATLAAQAVIAGGTQHQQAAWLPKLASGTVGTLALQEEHADWDLTNITATAKRAAGRIELSGKKLVVQWAEASGVIIASVSMDGGPALALITKDDLPKGALRREKIIDETRRSCALTLDGISLPEEQLLDPAKAAAALAHIELAWSLLQSAEMCGGTQSVIDYTVDYLQTRKQFGKIIGSYQALKHPIVDAYVEYEKARSLLYSAASSFGDQGLGEVAVRMAKAAADKAYSCAADRAIQFHGGFGFTHECDAGLHRRAAIFQASQMGDAAWQRAKLADLLFA